MKSNRRSTDYEYVVKIEISLTSGPLKARLLFKTSTNHNNGEASFVTVVAQVHFEGPLLVVTMENFAPNKRVGAIRLFNGKRI